MRFVLGTDFDFEACFFFQKRGRKLTSNTSKDLIIESNIRTCFKTSVGTLVGPYFDGFCILEWRSQSLFNSLLLK